MLDQRRRRWDDVVQMLYKCFVFAGKALYIKLAIVPWFQSRHFMYNVYFFSLNPFSPRDALKHHFASPKNGLIS